MNLSQFSKNKLEKDQMLAVKGGKAAPIYNDYTKKLNGGVWHVQGWSVQNADGSWGWVDNGSHWDIQPAN